MRLGVLQYGAFAPNQGLLVGSEDWFPAFNKSTKSLFCFWRFRLTRIHFLFKCGACFKPLIASCTHH